ncbi:hypothetical protein OG223_13580 [Streptomyces sp. NBC_01478]|uniref:hypothetical protein n=1 Tax=Streptomyces sp. NBC_01478 TaxID=2903882 RepID=UPI002E32B910|nr:hypothetical protein [Streptomyces sp. NBC_01478]
MGRLTERCTAALRRARDRFGVTDEASRPPEKQNDSDPLSDNELLDRLTDKPAKTKRFIEIRDAESKRRIDEDAAFSKSAVRRILIATSCIVAVILALGFLCYAARGIRLPHIPRPVWAALSVALATAVSAVGVALGRFVRGPRGGRDDED